MAVLEYINTKTSIIFPVAMLKRRGLRILVPQKIILLKPRFPANKYHVEIIGKSEKKTEVL